MDEPEDKPKQVNSRDELDSERGKVLNNMAATPNAADEFAGYAKNLIKLTSNPLNSHDLTRSLIDGTFIFL